MLRFLLLLILFVPLQTVFSAGIDIQKIRVRGANHVKDLRYFMETGLVSARNTAIEMQIEAYEKSLISYREAKHTERNLALKNAQITYEKFQGEFKAIAEILRDLVDKHQAIFNERNAEPYSDTTTKEKTLSTVEVGKQDESRALSAYNNRNYSYSAHLYLRSLRHYHQAFELRKWQPLVSLPSAVKKKPGQGAKKGEAAERPAASPATPAKPR